MPGRYASVARAEETIDECAGCARSRAEELAAASGMIGRITTGGAATGREGRIFRGIARSAGISLIHGREQSDLLGSNFPGA